MKHWWIELRFKVFKILAEYHIRRTDWCVKKMNGLNDKLGEYLEGLNDD